MSAPSKPWEPVGAASRTVNVPNPPNYRAPRRLTSSFTNPPMVGTNQLPQPPPIPARNYNHSHYRPLASNYPSYNLGYNSYSGLSNYGSGFNTFGSTYGGYGGFSGYGGYGGYGYNNRFGACMPGSDPESSFIRLAEESTRPTFQSIESLIQAVSSVSFMLESTFGAIYNSFRAVIGVAENVSRLRTMFGQFFSVFAIYKTLLWLYQKLLYILGMRQQDPSHDTAWNRSAAGANEAKPQKSWPVLVLMGIMLCGPYLMWKMINLMNNTSKISCLELWKQSNDPAHLATALHNFQAQNEQELSITAGDRLVVAPGSYQTNFAGGWVLVTADGRKAGLVPGNRIHISGQLRSASVQPSRSVNPNNGYFNNIPLYQEQLNYVTKVPNMPTPEAGNLNTVLSNHGNFCDGAKVAQMSTPEVGNFHTFLSRHDNINDVTKVPPLPMSKNDRLTTDLSSHDNFSDVTKVPQLTMPKTENFNTEILTSRDNFSDVTKVPQITPGMGSTNPRPIQSVVVNNESLKQMCDNSFVSENKVTSGSD